VALFNQSVCADKYGVFGLQQLLILLAKNAGILKIMMHFSQVPVGLKF